MRYQIEEAADAVLVTFEGEMDLEYAMEVRAILLDCVTQVSRVVVDMRGVTLIDSSGLASLLEAFQGARRRGKEFVLMGVGAAVNRVIRLARLDTVFVMVDTPDSP